MANPVVPRPSPRTHANLTIANGASVSDLVNITGHVVTGIQVSSSWTTACLGVVASIDGSTATMYPLKNSAGDFLTFQTSASQLLVFDPATLIAAQKIQIVSCTTNGVAVNQGAARSLVLSLAPAYIS